jgi:Tol biopolymer transport system component
VFKMKMLRLAAIIAAALALVATATAAAPERATVAFVNDIGLLEVGSDATGVTMLRDGSCPAGTLPPCPGAESATWSPDGSRLAAVVGTQLWLFGADGSRQLVPTGVAVSGGSPPAWSPDGKHVAFLDREVVDGFGTWFDVYVCDLVTGGVRRLTVGHQVADLAWAPGPQVVFASAVGDRFALFLVDGTGTVRQLTHPAESEVDRRPAWSPNGREIAFVHLRQIGEGAGHGRLTIISLDGSSVRTLSEAPLGVVLDQAPAWSPDGSKIAFTTSLNGRPSPITQIVVGRDLYVIGPDGTNERRLTESAERDVADHNPTWSADGSQLAFETFDREVQSKTSIYAVNADGTCERPLTDVPGWRPAWQPVAGATPPTTCADLSVIASSPRVLGTAGRVVVTVLNDGTQPLTGVRLTSSSLAATARSATASQGACSVKAGALSCTLGDLAPRRHAEVAVRVDSLLVTQAVGIVLGGRVTFRVAANEQETSKTDNMLSLEVETTRCADGLPGAGHLLGTDFDDRVCGRMGADRVVAGGGRDAIVAGAGADVIDARDSETDTVRCGPGVDTVLADRSDRVAADCEKVRRR